MLILNFWTDSKTAASIVLGCSSCCAGRYFMRGGRCGRVTRTSSMEYLSLITIFGGGWFIWLSMPLQRLILGKPSSQVRHWTTLYLVPLDTWSRAHASALKVNIAYALSYVVLLCIWFMCWFGLALVHAGKHRREYWTDARRRRRILLCSGNNRRAMKKYGYNWRRHQEGIRPLF